MFQSMLQITTAFLFLWHAQCCTLHCPDCAHHVPLSQQQSRSCRWLGSTCAPCSGMPWSRAGSQTHCCQARQEPLQRALHVVQPSTKPGAAGLEYTEPLVFPKTRKNTFHSDQGKFAQESFCLSIFWVAQSPKNHSSHKEIRDNFFDLIIAHTNTVPLLRISCICLRHYNPLLCVTIPISYASVTDLQPGLVWAPEEKSLK